MQRQKKLGSNLVSVLVAIASVVTSSTAKYLPIGESRFSRGSPGFSYNCSGKADGNYPHPTKCTHYVACVGKAIAYEMICALNHDLLPLHYVADSGPDPVTSRCDYPELAGCQANVSSTGSVSGGGTQQPTKTPPQFTTKSPSQVTLKPSIEVTTKATPGVSFQVTTKAPSQGAPGTQSQITSSPIQGAIGGPAQVTTKAPAYVTTKAPAYATTKEPGKVTTKAPWQVTSKSPSSSASNSPTKQPNTFNPNNNIDNCHPDEKCKLKGYCRKYFTYNKESNLWDEHECGQDLFWNEKAKNGSIHGGNCDFFLNTEPEVQEKYRNDPKCIPPCEWWQTDDQQCTGRYNYRIPFNNVTLLGRESMLECPHSGGETLVWVQNSLSCERCADATDSKGNACRKC